MTQSVVLFIFVFIFNPSTWRASSNSGSKFQFEDGHLNLSGQLSHELAGSLVFEPRKTVADTARLAQLTDAQGLASSWRRAEEQRL